MESRVTVHATLKEMERLFDDTKGGFLVKYYERTEHHQNYDTFKVIMRHGEDIGRQDGEVFGYQSFMDKFDNLESRFLKSDGKIFLDKDVDIAQQGLEGGLSEKKRRESIKNLRLISIQGFKIRPSVNEVEQNTLNPARTQTKRKFCRNVAIKITLNRKTPCSKEI